MSKGSGMGERILFGGLAKCNQELDCGPRFCFHRQNLLGYFQNLWSVQMNSKLINAVSLSLILLVAGCNKNSSSTVRNSNKVRVGYIGLTCEAPIYAAYEKGFFKEEGIAESAASKNIANLSRNR